MKLTITQEHVDRALANKDPFSGDCCPVAQAFMEAFKTDNVYACISRVRVERKDYRLSADLTSAIEEFFKLTSNLQFGIGTYEISEWI